MGTTGMTGRDRALLSLLWLLVRDEVSESSRGPGAMVGQKQWGKLHSSIAFLESLLIV